MTTAKTPEASTPHWADSSRGLGRFIEGLISIGLLRRPLFFQARQLIIRTAEPTAKSRQTVRVQPTRGGKGGKTVTVIRGLELDAAGFKALLKKLKTRIGSGGTAKDGVIELQGDQVDLALELLSKEGYRPKRAGG